MRERFGGSFVLSGGCIDAACAEANLKAGRGDLIAFGRSGLDNPDLPERLWTGAALNEADPNTLYTAGPESHSDYPTLGA